MKLQDGVWTYSYDEEHWTTGNYFETKEEAIAAGRSDDKQKEYHEDTDCYFVGKVKIPSLFVNTWGLIDDIQENYCDQSGEYAEEWYANINKEDIGLLHARVLELVKTWQKETENEPNFFTIVNSVEIPLNVES